jgi:hypothetical protein
MATVVGTGHDCLCLGTDWFQDSHMVACYPRDSAQFWERVFPDADTGQPSGDGDRPDVADTDPDPQTDDDPETVRNTTRVLLRKRRTGRWDILQPGTPYSRRSTNSCGHGSPADLLYGDDGVLQRDTGILAEQLHMGRPGADTDAVVGG